MVMVTYRRWSFYFTRGSNCKALTGKILEVVAYERWSHMEV